MGKNHIYIYQVPFKVVLEFVVVLSKFDILNKVEYIAFEFIPVP